MAQLARAFNKLIAPENKEFAAFAKPRLMQSCDVRAL
jgi:hypothetical protein